MRLADRLAQRSAPTRRETATQREAAAQREAAGFLREAIELCTRAGPERGASLGDDLTTIDLPTATQLAEALPTLAVLPKAGLDPQRPALMLDLETTGLLGEAGAVVCVVGVAWHVAPQRVRVEQWSLRRVGAEGAMLADLFAAIGPRLGPRTAIVTFNGSSFDLPLLRRRLVRHGVVGPVDEPLRAPHVDLLHPSRRLWRDRGPDCRLGTLEQRHLALHREGDVGGAEVVELLWRWLEDPSAASADDLARVQRHNRIDVLSLAALAHTLHTRLREPVDAIERVRAASHHARLGRPELALAVVGPLLDALADRPAVGRGSELSIDAALLAAELERQRDRHHEAARYWALVCRRAPGHPAAHEALAKHLEHHARRPAAALAIASASDTPCERRLARLRRKVGSAAIPLVPGVVDACLAPSV